MIDMQMRFTYFAENMSPYSLHVVPVCDDSVLHWIPNAQQSPVIFGFWSYKYIALQSTSHDSNMLWSSDTKILEIISKKPQSLSFLSY